MDLKDTAEKLIHGDVKGVISDVSKQLERTIGLVGIIIISLEGGCTGCSSTPMTAMQIYYSLMKLDVVNDVIFQNGELPAYMRAFIDDKLNSD